MGTDAQHPDLARLAAVRPSRLADGVSAVLDPVVVVPVVLVVVAVVSSPSPGAGLLWAALAALFCVALPYAVLLLLVRSGRVLDRHLVVREQRGGPLLLAVGSVALGLGVLVLLRAPGPVVGLVAAMLAGVAAMTLLSAWYKASFHVAVGAGSAVVLIVTCGGGWAAPLTVLVALLGWSRWRSGRHTVAQVVVGLLVGVATSAAVFRPLGG